MGRIDYVIPMVFDDDPLWRSDFMRLKRVYHDKAYYTACWRSWGTEHLLVKAVRKFMPWVRTIHILLARESQIMDWMKEEDIHIVLHRDFIPEKYLPTFSSNTIEMFLHKIPDLSEYFIYGNDDVYPLSPLKEEQFFNDGKPCQIYVERDFPEDNNIFYKFVKNGLDMIAADFGKEYNGKWLYGGHSLSPFLKSTCEKVWELHGDRILASLTPERSPDNFNQYIYAFYQHFSKNYCFDIPPRLLLTALLPAEKIARVITADDVGVVCINDYESVEDFPSYRKVVYEALKNKILND